MTLKLASLPISPLLFLLNSQACKGRASWAWRFRE